MSGQQSTGPDSTTTDTIRAVLAGNVDAFRHIVDIYQPAILTFITMILRDGHAARDVTHDVFVRAWQRLKSFDQTRPIKPWLMGIAYHAAADYRRVHARDTQYEQLLPESSPSTPGQEHPLDGLIRDEQSRMLWTLIDLLTPQERLTVVLFYREELSVEQVAHILEVSNGTVKTVLFRARLKLRTMIRERGITSLQDHVV